MPFRSTKAATLAAAIIALSAAPASAADKCRELLLPNSGRLAKTQVTAEALAQLRDIGPIYRLDYSRDIFSISPGGQYVAFQVHRADPAQNRYCVGIFILPLSGKNAPRLVDSSDELIGDRSAAYGWASFPVGVPITNSPRWSSDGAGIAYLKRVDGRTQVWLAPAFGGAPAKQITHSDHDVEDFRFPAGSRTITYSTRPTLDDREEEIDREAKRGWHFDQRALPIVGARPRAFAAKLDYFSVEIDGSAAKAASSQEIAYFSRPTGVPTSAAALAVSPNGQMAWTEPVPGTDFPADYQIVVKSPNNDRIICPLSECKLDWLSSIHWSPNGKSLRFSRREGWAESHLAIYEWTLQTRSVRRVYATADELIECHPLEEDLVCLRERSREPRHFVKVRLGRNKVEKLFDPNPEFASLSLGRVERLNWKNGFGVPFYGDLVYPTDFKLGRRFPMVVVLYRTRGFLRGGVGDEVPVQALASNGFFVLSVDVRDLEAVVGKQKDAATAAAAYNQNFLGRKHILSAIESVTQNLIDRGTIEARRVGISGLSEGASTVQYAAVNSTYFAAGSVGSCCWEPVQDSLLGPKIAERYHQRGWPRLIDRNSEMWSGISIMQQPEHVKFPLLLQLADSEYLAAAASYTALSQADVPADLYVFPDEEHVKWQPAHRLAVYRRNLAWFDYWLRDRLPADPIEREEAERWAGMRVKWRKGKSRDAVGN